MMRNRMVPGILAFIALAIVVALLGGHAPILAQDIPLATNTPRVLATNTPRPPVPVPVTPDAPLENYALRLWSEPGLVEQLAQQARTLRQGDFVVAGDVYAKVRTLSTPAGEKMAAP